MLAIENPVRRHKTEQKEKKLRDWLMKSSPLKGKKDYPLLLPETERFREGEQSVEVRSI